MVGTCRKFAIGNFSLLTEGKVKTKEKCFEKDTMETSMFFEHSTAHVRIVDGVTLTFSACYAEY